MKKKRTCKKCGKREPTVKFGSDYGKYGGASKWCSACRNAVNKEWYWRNRERSLEISKKYREKHRTELVEYHKKYYQENKHLWHQWLEKNREKRKASDRDYHLRLFLETMQAYGNKCSCCGESDLRFLTIEHINHDGKAHRKRVGNKRVHADLRRRGWPQEGITLFCWNCQMATRYGARCPHKEKVNEHSLRA